MNKSIIFNDEERAIKALEIQLMTETYAKEICEWKYEDIYTIYSFDDEAFEELMNGEYYSCVQNHQLIGYFCYGKSAQIPTIEKNIYDNQCIDIGLGLKPELCGKGLGKVFMREGIEFAKTISDSSIVRLTVASFNQRAKSLYESLGFIKNKTVHHYYSKMVFDIMEKEEG